MEKLSDSFNPVRDPACANGRGPMFYNGSTDLEYYTQCSPNVGATSGSGEYYASYNPPAGGPSIRFEDSFTEGRVRLDKSYIKIDYVACKGDANTPIDVATTSIPWNTMTLIQQATLKMNAGNVDIETLQAGNFIWGNMIRTLANYTSDALEAAEDRFFTPCIEEKLDTSTALSVASGNRSKKLVIASPAAPARGSKNIMLGDLFDSLRAPVAWPIQKLVIEMQFKPSTQILFHTALSVPTARFYITKAVIYFCRYKQVSPQLKEDGVDIASGDWYLRMNYAQYDAESVSITGTLSKQDGSIRNLQAGLLVIPVIPSSGGNVNPYQFTYGGMKSFQQTYESFSSPLQSVEIDPVNVRLNTECYALWRNYIRMTSGHDKKPSLTYEQAFGYEATYPIFVSTFTPMEVAVRKQVDDSTFRVVASTSSATAVLGYSIRHRMVALGIYGQGYIELIR